MFNIFIRRHVTVKWNEDGLRRLTQIVVFTMFFAGVGNVCAQETGPVEVVSETAEEEFYDPFAYHVQGEHGDSFIPAESDEMPQGIRVLAIMKAKDGNPFAVLRVAGEKHPFYVTEGDVVRVEKPQTLAGRISHTSGKNTSVVQEPVYLRVHEISGDSVEISPQKRPQEIHIFQ